MGKKKQSSGSNGGNQKGSVNDVAGKIAASEAGRKRKQAANKARHAANAKHLEEDKAKYLEQIADEEARLRAEMTVDPIDVNIECEKIFNGTEGFYNLFGLSVRVRSHETGSESIMVLELMNALHETGILNVARPGTFIPIHALRMNPQRVQWRMKDVQAISEWFHKNPFGMIAMELRRQHFAELMAQKRKEAPRPAVKQSAPKKESAQTQSFSERSLAACGLCMMPDGVVISTWNNPHGAHCAGVRFAPEGHALEGYQRYIKTAHLEFDENWVEGHELREYLRKQLAEISETAAA